MNLQPDDPRLTAYVLGELGTEDAAAVERAAAEDPAVQAEIMETREIQHFLTDRLALPADKLQPHQRENVRRSAREAERAGKAISFINALQPWLFPVAAAAVLALATIILSRMPNDKPALVAVTAPAPAAVSPLPAAAANNPAPVPVLPPAVPHGSVAVADSPILGLPILNGKPDLESISKSIRIDKQLPPRSSVRLEEILNGFPLRLNGVAAIARGAANTWHPDNRDSGMSAHVATLSTEMIACPWKPSATLLFISLRGNPRSACDVRIAYHANPGGVARYRLLGFAPAEGPTATNLPAKLAANSTTTLAIEIESSKPGGDLGTLEWSTDDQPAPTISLIHKRDAEPSDDARFAALVCTYAQWLAGEQAGIINADILSALAREIASSTLPADRADFLELIDGSLLLQPQ
jgi:hypothetical protein